jgi:TonB family protein
LDVTFGCEGEDKAGVEAARVMLDRHRQKIQGGEMRTNQGNDSPTRKADLNTPAGRFSTRLLMQRRNKFQELLSNLREVFTFHPVKFAGNVSMTQPVWIRDKNLGPSQIASFAIHGGLALLLIIPIASQISQKPIRKVDGSSIFAPPPDYLKRLLFRPNPGIKSGGGGTGGENNPIPTTVGQAPKFGPTQIVPPSIIRNQNPILIVPPNLVGQADIQIKNPDINIWGDPTKRDRTDSGGPGCCSGMGSHKGPGGLGDGDGGQGLGPGGGGNVGGGPMQPGSASGVTYPVCQYCPRPDYPEEARKVKYSGSVTLNVVVLPNGKTGRIEVVNSPGMGLDEKAVEAVRGWLFKAGVGPNGKPVATVITIEVIFQLF